MKKQNRKNTQKQVNGNIVALDPGKYNFAWCVVSPHGKLLHSGLIQKTFNDMKSEDILEGISLLSRVAYDVGSLSNKVDRLVFERFVPRGMNTRGNLSEIVNFSIGIFISHFPCLNINPVMASGWKTWTKNRFTELTNKTIPIHILDCYQMALYSLAKSGLSLEIIQRQRNRVDIKNYNWTFKKQVWIKNAD